MCKYSFGECWRHHMAKLWDKEITVDEQISLLEDFSSYLEVSMLVTIEKFKSIIILQKMGWLNDARDFLTNTLPEVCDEVGQYLVKSKLMNPPNWKIFLKDRLEIAKEAGQAIYSYHEKCFQICASQYQQQYQATYEQDLAKQDGLGFGIISSSLAAHLVYAAQSASKERANEKKASEAADRIMHSSLSPVDKAAQMTIAFYHEKFDPFVNEFLISFYSDIERLIYDGLDADKETLDNNKVCSGNELTNITEDNHRECITASLSIYPFNGDALFWAIRYDDAGDELIEFCSANPLLLPKYLVAIEQRAVAYLKKQKEKADLYNRDPLTEDIVQFLHRIRAFLTDERMYGVSTYENIVQEVYGERIDFTCEKFAPFLKTQKNESSLANYARDHKTLNISENDFETLQRYNAIFGISKISNILGSLPSEVESFNGMLSSICEEIKTKYEKHQESERRRKQREFEKAEQERKAEEARKAEEQRQKDLVKARNKKIFLIVASIASIVASIVAVIVIFIVLLNSVIIPNGKYADAIALMNAGKYEDAIEAFEALDGYKDSNSKIKECRTEISDAKLEAEYKQAVELMDEANYEEAIKLFYKLNGYKDSKDKIASCEKKIQNNKYNDAISLYRNGRYEDAIQAFSKLGNYLDSNAYIKMCNDAIIENKYLTANTYFNKGDFVQAIKTYQELGDYKDSTEKLLLTWQYVVNRKTFATGYFIGKDLVAIKEDGTIYHTSDYPWTNIIEVSMGFKLMVGLKDDGTVIAVGDNDYGQCNVNSWKNIVSIDAGNYHVVGLKSDGTVVATGGFMGNGSATRVSSWKNIIAVEAGYDFTLGLKDDGTVLFTGHDPNNIGKQVAQWTDIIAISAGLNHAVGLKKDGTVVAAGSRSSGQCNVENWSNIVYVEAGCNGYTFGITSSGKVLLTGKNSNENYKCDVSTWNDIIAIAAGDFVVGLKSDGTFVFTGTDSDTKHPSEAELWTDVKLP